MHEDKLEQFIRQNREGFDDATPPAQLWPAIARAPAKKTWHWLRPAAAAIALLTLGAVLGYYANNKTADTVTALSTVHPEYQEVEQYYQEVIRTKQAQLVHYVHDGTITQDLTQLEIAFEELKQEFEEHIAQAPKQSQQQIVHAMLQNYQERVAILERVLQYLDARNLGAKNKNNDEKNM